MQEKTGDIWSIWQQPNQIILVTTNNTKGTNGLVMGAGTAKQAMMRIPGLSRKWYHLCGKDYHIWIEYLLGIGCIQTKRFWADPSPLELVLKSIETLNREVRLPTNEHITYHTARPGCGLGGLNWEQDIKPICLMLPDNCVVWSQT